MSVMTEEERERDASNKFKGKLIAWTVIAAGFVGILGIDHVLNDDAPPPATNISDYMPNQADCNVDPTLMGC